MCDFRSVGPSPITECFRVTEKQILMFVNALKIATLGDECLSHLHHLGVSTLTKQCLSEMLRNNYVNNYIGGQLVSL